MTTKARVEWDGHRWVAVLDAGGVTQARQLAQLPARLAEVHELMTGEAISVVDVELDIDFTGAVEAKVLEEERAELATRQHALAEQTQQIVEQQREAGASVRDIAWMVGVSHQRVQQLLAESPVYRKLTDDVKRKVARSLVLDKGRSDAAPAVAKSTRAAVKPSKTSGRGKSTTSRRVSADR